MFHITAREEWGGGRRVHWRNIFLQRSSSEDIVIAKNLTGTDSYSETSSFVRCAADAQMSKSAFKESNVLFQILNISDAGNKQKRKNTNVLGSRSKYRTRRLRTDEVKDNVTNKAPGIMCFISERKDSVYKCSSELEERIEGNERLYKSEMQDDKTGGILSSNIEGIQYKVGSENLQSLQSVTFLSSCYLCQNHKKIIKKNSRIAIFTAEPYLDTQET